MKLLLACQYQQLRVNGQYFTNGVLKFPAGGDACFHFLKYLFGDVLGMFLAVHHEGIGPHRVASLWTVGATAGMFATAQVAEGERAWQERIGDGEPAEEIDLALEETRRDHL